MEEQLLAEGKITIHEVFCNRFEFTYKPLSCDHTLTHATKILEGMKEEGILDGPTEHWLNILRFMGGHCDCEVLLNVVYGNPHADMTMIAEVST